MGPTVLSLALSEQSSINAPRMLAMPPTPLEVMSGKIIPYVFIGLIQSTIILLAAYFLFGVPFVGNILLLYFVALLFISANLTVGITVSSIAHST